MDLDVALHVLLPVVVGLSVPATVVVTNRGPAPVTISYRLNLMEGDVRLSILGPDGATRVLKGWQADTALRRVTVPPGWHIEGTMNLLWSEAGATFPSPGPYVLRAEYDPSPQEKTVVSLPTAVAARLPQTAEERGVAHLLTDFRVRDAIVLAKSEIGPEKLLVLAQQSGETLDGKLARLLLLGSAAADGEPGSEDALPLADPITLARWVGMLSSPYSKAGKRLADALVVRLRMDSLTVSDDDATRTALQEALRIVRQEPSDGQFEAFPNR